MNLEFTFASEMNISAASLSVSTLPIRILSPTSVSSSPQRIVSPDHNSKPIDKLIPVQEHQKCNRNNHYFQSCAQNLSKTITLLSAQLHLLSKLHYQSASCPGLC